MTVAEPLPQRLSEAQVMDRLRAVLSDRHLSPVGQNVVIAWLQEAARKEMSDLDRINLWLTLQILSPQKRAERLRSLMSPFQLGCPDLIPRLSPQPVWPREALPWVSVLEGAWEDVRDELLAMRGKGTFQQYRAPSWAGTKAEDGRGSVGHDAGDWNVCYLYLHNMDFSENLALCPKTRSLIESVPRHYHHAFFSALAPGTHVAKHNGPTNKKLRVHLPLVVPKGQCFLRVADETVCMEEGRCIIFDDSFEHEAFNRDPSKSRLVLILDVWHPELSESEVKFFSLLQRATLRAEKRMCERWREEGTPPGHVQEDDFYALIEKGRRIGSDETNVWRS